MKQNEIKKNLIKLIEHYKQNEQHGGTNRYDYNGIMYYFISLINIEIKKRKKLVNEILKYDISFIQQVVTEDEFNFVMNIGIKEQEGSSRMRDLQMKYINMMIQQFTYKLSVISNENKKLKRIKDKIEKRIDIIIEEAVEDEKARRGRTLSAAEIKKVDAVLRRVFLAAPAEEKQALFDAAAVEIDSLLAAPAPAPAPAEAEAEAVEIQSLLAARAARAAEAEAAPAPAPAPAPAEAEAEAEAEAVERRAAAPAGQSNIVGGSINFKQKYLKYKTLYLNLKNST